MINTEWPANLSLDSHFAEEEVEFAWRVGSSRFAGSPKEGRGRPRRTVRGRQRTLYYSQDGCAECIRDGVCGASQELHRVRRAKDARPCDPLFGVMTSGIQPSKATSAHGAMRRANSARSTTCRSFLCYGTSPPPTPAVTGSKRRTPLRWTAFSAADAGRTLCEPT